MQISNNNNWHIIESGLEEIDWQPMDDLACTSPEAALSWFHERVLKALENHVPKKKPRKSGGHSRMHRMRRLLWRRLSKVDSRLKAATTMNKKAKLLQLKWELKKQLADDYMAVNNKDEDNAVLRIKQNPKAFFSFTRGRQNTRAKVGPFMDPTSRTPNSSPDYCCTALQQQYDSVFAVPRPEWKVDNFQEHFEPNDELHDALTDIAFSKEDIEKACLQLSSSSSPGPD